MGTGLIHVRAGHPSLLEGQAPCLAGRLVLKKHYHSCFVELAHFQRRNIPTMADFELPTVEQLAPRTKLSALGSCRELESSMPLAAPLPFQGARCPCLEEGLSAGPGLSQVSEGPMIPVTCWLLREVWISSPEWSCSFPASEHGFWHYTS